MRNIFSPTVLLLDKAADGKKTTTTVWLQRHGYNVKQVDSLTDILENAIDFTLETRPSLILLNCGQIGDVSEGRLRLLQEIADAEEVPVVALSSSKEKFISDKIPTIDNLEALQPLINNLRVGSYAKMAGSYPKSAYFLSLMVENVRCFGSPSQTLDLSNGIGKPKQWTIILGDNGTGKTTLLQTLAAITPKKIALENEQYSFINSHYVEELTGKLDLFREKKKAISLLNLSEFNNEFLELVKDKPKFLDEFLTTGQMFSLNAVFCIARELTKPLGRNIKIGLSVLKGEKLTFYDNDNEFSNNPLETEFVIFAYGASRKSGKTSLSEQNKEDSSKTLFDETVFLLNPEEWLLQADYAASRDSKFKEKRKDELEIVKRILINILPDVDDIRFTEKKSGRTPQPIVEFHTHYGWVESKDLSLGYRTSMAWIVDFASRMFDRYPESENPLEEAAVVLIDEIDLHLHPKWQRDLIDYLTNLFPNTQFIVTTHSPLIVQAAAARDANLVVLRREGDHVVIDQSIEAVRGWRADQILTSDLFDLPSARPKETEELLKQRKLILSKAKLTKTDEKKLKEISEKLGSLPVMENPGDDKAMDIIRRAAAHLQQEKRKIS